MSDQSFLLLKILTLSNKSQTWATMIVESLKKNKT